MTDCSLCNLEERTHWYHDGPDFAILDCCTCGVPMAVVRRHTISLEDGERERMLNELHKAADEKLGPGKWRFDRQMRTVKDHWHCHARAL